MSSYIQDANAEIIALVIATIPSSEATTTNVYRSVAAAKDNLLELKTNSKITFPLWIVDCADPSDEFDFETSGKWKRLPLRIIEIREGDGNVEPQDTIQSHLKLLDDAISDGANVNFWAIERGNITTGPSDETLKQMLMERKLNLYAGTLSFDPGVLCDAT